MKIAHVTFMRDMSSGVENRILGMAHGLKKLDRQEEVDFYFINNKKKYRNDTIHLVPFKERLFPLNYYDRFFCGYDLIEKSIDLKSYEYIFLRYPLADASGIEFMAKYNVITEHHTLELQYSKSFLNSDIQTIMRVAKKIRLKQEKLYGYKILKSASGIIGVTDEIRNFELIRAGCPIPSITIPNGILVDQIKLTGFKPFDGKNLHLVMIVSSFYPWIGLDRIISGINRYKGNVNIRLHLVGSITKKDVKYPNLDFSNVDFHGYQSGAEMDQLMMGMNLAVGTLAWYRVDMKEACTLKTREYMARGIPFVLSYKDSDLGNIDDKNKFYIEFENSGSGFRMF